MDEQRGLCQQETTTHTDASESSLQLLDGTGHNDDVSAFLSQLHRHSPTHAI